MQCECYSVLARITINGYSPTLIFLQHLIEEGLSSTSGEYSYFALQAKLMEKDLITAFANKMKFDQTSLTLKLIPIPQPGSTTTTLTHTTFETVITFACNGKNPSINKDGVIRAWNELQLGLFHLKEIQTHFLFPAQSEVVSGSVEDTPSTLDSPPIEDEDDEEKPINGVNGIGMGMGMSVVLVVMTIFATQPLF